MMIKKLILLALGVLCFSSAQVYAQSNDVQLRSQIGIEYTLKKKWHFGASYRYDRNQYLSAFRRGNINVSASYKINKHLKFGTSYRFMTSYIRDIHRFRVFAEYDWDLNKKWSLEARTMLQHDMRYLQQEYLSTYNPKWVFRERVSLIYNYTKKWRFAIYTEPFIAYQDAEFNLYRWRNGASASYLYKKRHAITATYFFQKGLGLSAHKNAHVFGIQYTFDLNKPKKKNKKKSSQ